MAAPIINLSYLNGSNGFRIKEKFSGFNFGISVSGAGDMNGDGFDEVMVGARAIYPPGMDFSRSYVVFGKDSGFDAVIDNDSLNGNNGFRLRDLSAPFTSPFWVRDAGDVNGDGYDDVIIGAEGFYSSSGYYTFKGAGYLVFGKPGGFSADIELSDLNGDDGFRLEVAKSDDIAVSGGGDVNGDGLDDVIITAPGEGATYVVFGKASGFDATMDLTRLDGNDGFRLEGVVTTVNNAVDINGDGFDDISVGLDNQSAGYVLYGKASGFDPVISLATVDGANGFYFSDKSSNSGDSTLNEAGDINDDGIDDLSIGKNVLFGRTTGFAADVDLSSLDGVNGFRVAGGVVVGSAGDLNGDGIDDVMIDGSYVIFGKTSGFDAIFDLSSLDGNNGFKVEGGGGAFNSAGDVNGDGFDDLIIGGGNYASYSYVMFGGPFIPEEPINYLGTAGDDLLTGTILAERFDGGEGNDVINGLGGADVLKGGAGEDIIAVINLDFEQINGGTDNDILALAGHNIHLDLADYHHIIDGIETIDLRGGDNTLSLSLPTLLGLSDTTHTFTINGGVRDRVLGLNNGWMHEGIDGNYRVFANNGTTLRVHVAVKTDALMPGVIRLTDLDGSNGFRINGAEELDNFGQSISEAGDINGDGFDDVIIGAPFATSLNGDPSGTSYVVFGKASGFDASLDVSDLDGKNGFRLDGITFLERFGSSVGTAGDINGDDFDDVIIGAPITDHNGNASGSSYVVFGKASGFDAVMDLSKLDGNNGFRMDGVMAEDESGMSVSRAGDFNGDGFDDVIVGAPDADPNGPSSGSSYVVFGKASGFDALLNLSSLDGANGFRLDGVEEGDSSGSSVSSAGDVNGDGFDDLIVGAPRTDQNGYSSGSSYVVFGRSSGFDASLDLFSLDGNTGFHIQGEEGYAGSSISGAGDVNGDGFDDVIVGAFRANASYVVFGKASGFSSTLDLSTLDGSNGFRLDGPGLFGFSVSNAGDVNGDSFDDVIIGAYDAGPIGDGSSAGSSYVIFGKSSGFNARMDLTNFNNNIGIRLDGGEVGNQSGKSVSGAGDINGDGFDDMMVGAPNADPNGESSGSSYVIFGKSSFTGGNVIAGTPEDDVLRGSPDADIFEAGAGNDLMIGRGGADVFHGGKGVDHIKVTDLNFRQIDGGTGNDVLHTDGKDLSLDLTDYLDKIQGIETICLYGRGDNSMTLTGAELKDLSDTTNTLNVYGNAGDRVILEGKWVDGGNHGFYHMYTQDDAVLLVGMNRAAVFA